MPDRVKWSKRGPRYVMLVNGVPMASVTNDTDLPRARPPMPTGQHLLDVEAGRAKNSRRRTKEPPVFSDADGFTATVLAPGGASHLNKSHQTTSLRAAKRWCRNNMMGA